MRVTTDTVAHLQFLQIMCRAGLWDPSARQSGQRAAAAAATVGGDTIRVDTDGLARVRDWFRNTLVGRRDRVLKSVASYLDDGDAVLDGYVTRHRRVHAAVASATLLTATILLVGSVSPLRVGVGIVFYYLMLLPVLICSVAGFRSRWGTNRLAASLEKRRRQAVAAIPSYVDSSDPRLCGERLVAATASAIQRDQPIADEAVGFVAHFVEVERAEPQTPSWTTDQAYLSDTYGPDHADPDIAEAVRQALDQQQRREQEQHDLHKRRTVVEGQAGELIGRIRLERDKLTAAAILHTTS